MSADPEPLPEFKPVPRPAFRGDLRRRLLALGPPRARPRHLRLLAMGYAAGGLILLIIGALSAWGVGPLGT